MRTSIAQAVVYHFDLEAYKWFRTDRHISKLSKNVLSDVIKEKFKLWEQNLGLYFNNQCCFYRYRRCYAICVCEKDGSELFLSVVFPSALFATAVAEHTLELYRGEVGAPQAYSSVCLKFVWPLHVFHVFFPDKYKKINKRWAFPLFSNLYHR